MSNSPDGSGNGSAEPATELDVVVVGAGFSGLYLLHRFRALELSTAVIEAGDEVGGTWYWNRYAGARCDVESLTYSYSWSDELQQEWEWSERYPRQAEILRYVGHVADRFDLRRDIRFETLVTEAVFDEITNRWAIRTDQGDHLSARFCIMATGCLSVPNRPDFPGIDDFKGDTYHTGLWPHEGVDFTGKRVGFIGTGSTGIQAIPELAKQAAHLTVFQRTANFSVPAWNGPLDPRDQEERKASYPDYRQIARESPIGDIFEVGEMSGPDLPPEEVQQELEKRWNKGGFGMLLTFSDILSNEEVNEVAAEFVRNTEFVRNKIRERVDDPDIAELLCPRDHPFGTKRLCVDTDYYETYNRDNVTLVDVKNSPIEALTPTGLRIADAEFEFDAIVFATGFDAMTGALFDIDIRGRGGEALEEKWSAGPRTYLGVATAGFPNLFMITGPGSPSVLSNMMVSIEQHVEWVTECIAHLIEHDIDVIEPTHGAEDEWVEHVREVGEQTLYPRADSWYMGANIPGKPRVFTPYVGGVGRYRQTCDEVVAKGYKGFTLGARPTEGESSAASGSRVAKQERP